MFNSDEKLKSRIVELETQVKTLEGKLEVKDLESKFYESRGDRYFTALDNRHKESQELLSLAKDILSKVIEKAVK